MSEKQRLRVNVAEDIGEPAEKSNAIQLTLEELSLTNGCALEHSQWPPLCVPCRALAGFAVQ